MFVKLRKSKHSNKVRVKDICCLYVVAHSLPSVLKLRRIKVILLLFEQSY